MKKMILMLTALCMAAGAAETATDNPTKAQAPQGGILLKSINFESPSGFSKWPADSQVELDTEDFKEGKSSIVFTPDNHYVAYFYQKLTPGHEYVITCWAKMDTEPIKRCGIGVNFAKQGGANSSAGNVNFPFAELIPADNEWHFCKVTFKAPENAVRGQVMLSLLRTNATVFIDDFKLYDMSAKSVAQGTTVTKGTPLKAMKFNSNKGIYSDPKGKITLGKPEENDGRACLVFIPNNDKDCLAYTAYFYQRLFPGDYVVEFDYQTPSDPIARAALIIQFSGPGKKLGEVGTITKKVSDFGACDGSWQHAVIPFKVPQGVNNARIMFAFYRINVPIRIADFKIFKTASAE